MSTCGDISPIYCSVRRVAPVKQAQQATAAGQMEAEAQFLAARWLALNDFGYPVPGLGHPLEQMLMELMWPPWYTVAVWRWASQLGWHPHPGNTGRHRGITYLELLVNFIVVAKLLPPKLLGVSGKGRYVNLLGDEGRLLPFTCQEIILTFASSIKAMTRLSGQQILKAPRHHRILALGMFHAEGNGRKGLLDRPAMTQLQDTVALLTEYLENKQSECLRHACGTAGTPNGVSADLALRWQNASASRQRKALGRGL